MSFQAISLLSCCIMSYLVGFNVYRIWSDWYLMVSMNSIQIFLIRNDWECTCTGLLLKTMCWTLNVCKKIHMLLGCCFLHIYPTFLFYICFFLYFWHSNLFYNYIFTHSSVSINTHDAKNHQDKFNCWNSSSLHYCVCDVCLNILFMILS